MNCGYGRRAPVPDIPHIKDKRGTAVEPLLEIFNGTDPCGTDLPATFYHATIPPARIPENCHIPYGTGCRSHLLNILVKIIDENDRVLVIEEPAGKG